ncbi:uncharacterized protein LOC131686138 [Topomyia yanbarensis]|uniref:uncharacterized protein LOC131686138 n=1 Tax=Topomyia yanbarensis TaxID=2498891 RepID=UPI00273A924D|nr:uncharacterized protein LOC131686138 [Topomyia yanbarensis]
MNNLQFGDLPPELQLSIFDCLDFRSRIECSLVCKTWNRLAMSGSFMNNHVLIKVETDCNCIFSVIQKPPADFRYTTSILLQSDRKYRAMTIHYKHGTTLRINSMRSLFRKFSELTYLNIDQKIKNTHVDFLRQILIGCPKLKCLQLNVRLMKNKNQIIKTFPNTLEKLILWETPLNDFCLLIKMFSNVPKLSLQKVRLQAAYVESLATLMPELETLELHEVYSIGGHSLHQLKRLRRLRELTIDSSRFSTGFKTWPKLPPNIRFVTVSNCTNVLDVEQLRERWGHAEKLVLNANNIEKGSSWCAAFLWDLLYS